MGGHIDRKTIGIEGVSEWKERNLKRDLRRIQEVYCHS